MEQYTNQQPIIIEQAPVKTQKPIGLQVTALVLGIIGFVLAWLLVSSRGKEIAVMRALGTRPFEIVAIFFAEQMLLCGAGLGLGLLIEKLFGHTIGPQLKMLVLLFYAVWLVSSLICLFVSVTKQAYAALAEPE